MDVPATVAEPRRGVNERRARTRPDSPKLALARLVVDDVERYFAVKDPVFDIIMAAAEDWAEPTRWRPGPTDA